jgi:NADPH2:quinone reductase
MKARGLVVKQFGDWRNVEMGNVELPSVGPNDILVDVEAVSLNFPDLLLIEGKYQARPEVPFIAGRDAAGVVRECGAEVTRHSVGDRVAVQVTHGAFADRLIVAADRAARLPDALSFAAGAASATVFATAHVALDIRARLQPGERVLVAGAAGGVGTAMLQLCRLRGGIPIALVSSEQKAAFVRMQGAEAVIRTDLISDLHDGLRQALSDEGFDGVDVVADVVGGDVFDASLRVLRPEGRMLVVGFTSGRIPEMRANYALLKNIAILGSPLEHYLEISGVEVMQALEKIFVEIPTNDLEAIVTARFPLSDFNYAAEQLISRKVLGKEVLILKESLG